jgi:hypothetical protein
LEPRAAPASSDDDAERSGEWFDDMLMWRGRV